MLCEVSFKFDNDDDELSGSVFSDHLVNFDTGDGVEQQHLLEEHGEDAQPGRLCIRSCHDL